MQVKAYSEESGKHASTNVKGLDKVVKELVHV